MKGSAVGIDAIIGAAVKKNTFQTKRDLRKSKYFELLTRAARPIIKPTHPVCQDVNDLLHREIDPRRKTEAFIIHDKTPDAFIFNHGSMYVSTGLLNKIENEDELIWLLGHEYDHYLNSGKANNLSKARTWFQHMASARIQEYHGDIGSFIRMSRAGRNPSAGISVLEKLSKGERSGGLVHGDTIHRILNLHWITKLMDLKGLESPLTPYRIDTSRITSNDYIREVPDISKLIDPTGNDETYGPELRKCDLFSTIAAYTQIMENEKSFKISITGRANFSVLTSRLLQNIENAAYDLVKDDPDADDKATMIAELVRIFCCGHQVEYSYTNSDLKTLVSVMDPKYFEQLGLMPTFDYGSVELVRALAPNLLKGYLRKRFLATFEPKLKRLMTTLPDAARSELGLMKMGAYDQHGDRLEEIMSTTDSSMSDKYAKRLGRMSRKDAVKELYDLKPALITRRLDLEVPRTHYNATEDVNEAYAEVGGDLFLQPTKHADRRQTIKSIQEWIYICRALQINPSHPAYATNHIQDLMTVKQFEQLVRAIDDNAEFKQRYPFAEPLPLQDKDYFVNAIRKSLIENVWKTKDMKALHSTLRGSLRAHPKSRATAGTKAVLEEVLSQMNPAKLTNQNRELIYLLSLFQSPMQRDFIQSNVLMPLFDNMDFDAAYDFVTTGLGKITTMQPIEQLIEEKAKTIPQMRKLVSVQSKLAKMVTEEPDADFGAASAIGYIQKTVKLDRLNFLKCALNTQYGERELKRLLYRSWRETPEAEKSNSGIDQIGLEHLLDMQTLYLMDLKYKYLTLRICLADATHGVLVKPETKKRLAPTILSELVEAGDKRDRKALDLVEKLLGSLVENAPINLSYFTLLPVMMNKLFLPAHEHVSNFEVVVDYEFDALGLPQDRAIRTEGREALKALTYHEQYPSRSHHLKRWKEFVKKHNIPTPVAESMEHALIPSRSGIPRLEAAERGVVTDVGLFEPDDEKEIPLKGAKTRAFFGEKTQKMQARKMSPLEFIVDTAKNLGSPGPRFLQLIGQYADIDNDYQQEFQNVYDNIKGQSKLTAFQIVSREWPDMDRYIYSIDESIGGGSLTTVYKARWKDKSLVALKVLNPNLEYFNDTAFDIIKKTLETLAKTDKRYHIGLEVLDDIRHWVEGDINFTGFLQKDREFREQNHGFEGPCGYRIIVPRSFRPESKYFKLEEFIEGTNLTRPDELEAQGHDLKAIVSTIGRNYFTQIRNGRAHADVHPGNFRITPKREIAILDRNFYLDLSQEDQTQFTAAMVHAMEGNSEGVASFVCDYLASTNGNAKMDKDKLRKGLIKELNKNLRSKAPLADRLLGTVRYVRTNGYTLPLRMTLLTRNIHSVQKFSERAKFQSVEKALMYEG